MMQSNGQTIERAELRACRECGENKELRFFGYHVPTKLYGSTCRRCKSQARKNDAQDFIDAEQASYISDWNVTLDKPVEQHSFSALLGDEEEELEDPTPFEALEVKTYIHPDTKNTPILAVDGFGISHHLDYMPSNLDLADDLVFGQGASIVKFPPQKIRRPFSLFRDNGSKNIFKSVPDHGSMPDSLYVLPAYMEKIMELICAEYRLDTECKNDLRQDVALSILEGVQTTEGKVLGASDETWLTSVCRNACFDWLRKHGYTYRQEHFARWKAQREMELGRTLDAERDREAIIPAKRKQPVSIYREDGSLLPELEGVEGSLEAQETLVAIEQVRTTDTLSEHEWRLIALGTELDDKQLADHVGGSYETVRKQRQRAVRKLKAALAHYPE